MKRFMSFVDEFFAWVLIPVEIILGLLTMINIKSVDRLMIIFYLVISFYLIVVLAILFKVWYIDPKKKK